jgi:hypothetical protein
MISKTNRSPRPELSLKAPPPSKYPEKSPRKTLFACRKLKTKLISSEDKSTQKKETKSQNLKPKDFVGTKLNTRTKGAE